MRWYNTSFEAEIILRSRSGGDHDGVSMVDCRLWALDQDYPKEQDQHSQELTDRFPVERPAPLALNGMRLQASPRSCQLRVPWRL